MLGDEIARTVVALRGSGRLAIREDVEQNTVSYELTGMRCHVDIVVSRNQGIRLSFEVRDEQKINGSITHDIDTDLYDISQQQFQEFARDIEKEIVEFLCSLIAGQILIGKIDKKAVVVIPYSDGFWRIEKGKFLTSRKRFATLSEAKSGGRFESLIC